MIKIVSIVAILFLVILGSVMLGSWAGSLIPPFHSDEPEGPWWATGLYFCSHIIGTAAVIGTISVVIYRVMKEES